MTNKRLARLIPALAAVGLTATGCDGDSESSGGSSSSPARAMCEKMWTCDTEYYVAEYTNIDGCVAYLEDQLAEYSQVPACGNAMKAYLGCLARKSTCEPYTDEYTGETGKALESGTACDTEYAAVEANC